ncbi:hypothetical protein OROGR_026002 [Orobanche gracilis]
MTMHQLDPDVVRWGLHLLDVCSLSDNGSPLTVTCYEEDLTRTGSVKEGFSYPTYSVVENDEVIAQALQEELSKLDAAEDSRFVSSEEQHHKASILAQSWLGHSGRNMDSEYQGNQGEAGKDEVVLSERDSLSTEGKDRDLLPKMESESALDGELGKRLNQMVAVPHVPKINGEIPSFDEVTSDHQRLLNRKVEGCNCENVQWRQQYSLVPLTEGANCKAVLISRVVVIFRLELYDLFELKISGDGNCQLKNGEWGDHVTLQAAADWFGFKIFIITSFKDTCYIEILPQTLKSNRIIFLSFWSEVHYNSIYPVEELPMVESKKKKRWWW